VTDLRRFARAPFVTDLTFSSPEEGERVGRARDISLGGMFITTDEAAPFGAQITIRFTLPTEPIELELPAVVRWSGTGGMGVQFGSLGAADTHHITELTRPPV
jgi:hypothetical protein